MYKPVPQVHSSNEGEDSESELFNSSTLNFDEKSPQYGMQEQEPLFEHFRYDCHFFFSPQIIQVVLLPSKWKNLPCQRGERLL